MKVKVSIDRESFTEKPSGFQIGMIKKRIGGCWREISLEELADLNGNRGHTIAPACFEGGVKTKDCTAMQLFALDFDGEYTFAEFKGKCDELGLRIAYAYHTFSSKEEKEKFRTVFVWEELVTDRFIMKAILIILHSIFPERDRSCINLDRMYFGGKGLIHFDKSARLSLVQLHIPFMKSLDRGKHFSDLMKDFAKKSGIPIINGHLAMGRLEDRDMIIGENVDPAVIHITGKTTNSPFFIVEKTDGWVYQRQTCKKEKMRNIEIKKGESPCRLYNDFEAGKRLEHDTRFGIFTNMIHIIRGRTRFMELTREFYGEETFGEWMSRQKYYKGFHSKRCSPEFCPYHALCENSGTIVETMARDRKVYCDPEEYVPIREAEECLIRNLESAFRSPEKGMHLIRAQTGIGKTSMYVRLIAENRETRFLIALPTNSLKEEVGRTLVSVGIAEKDIFMTASVHGNPFIPPEIQSRIVQMHERGIHNMTGKIINDYYNKLKEEPCKKYAAEEECRKILAGIRGIGGERIVVTTHAYLAQLRGSFLKDFTVIIDEDFLQLQIFNRMHRVRVKCLEELAEEGAGEYAGLVSGILRSEAGKYEKTGANGCLEPIDGERLQELESFGPEDDINDLALAGAYVRKTDPDTKEEVIHYFCPLVLPDLKYIVLSATLNYEIYKSYFAGRAEIFTYPERKASYRGRLCQYTYHSLGRNGLTDKEQVFDLAREMARDPKINIITFKMFEEKFAKEGKGRLNPAGIHFGNSTGINLLAGKDLAVIGTPYKVEEYYKLIARYLGGDVNREGDKRMSLRRVKYKGRSFLITAYKNPVLQEVQLYSIESELEQCIGRARLLRNDCSVFVFSCFPCEQAEIHITNYLLEEEAGAGGRP